MELITPIVAMAALAALCGAGLGYAAMRLRSDSDSDPVVERIDALLPQTQCGQCGYPGCRPYARAIAGGDAINKCPPGGEATVLALADLLGEAPQPLDGDTSPAQVAVIREEACIGCFKCVEACPVDAIVGAPRFTHTVIASECTGCDLCVEPCPVDCIDMVARPTDPVQVA